MLIEALRGARAAAGARPQGWGGGEALAMRDVRRYLDAERPAVDPLNVMGYWKHRATPDDVDY